MLDDEGAQAVQQQRCWGSGRPPGVRVFVKREASCRVCSRLVFLRSSTLRHQYSIAVGNPAVRQPLAGPAVGREDRLLVEGARAGMACWRILRTRPESPVLAEAAE